MAMERNGIPADDQVQNAVIVERLNKLSEVRVQHRTSSDGILAESPPMQPTVHDRAGSASRRGRCCAREGRPSRTPSRYAESSPCPISSPVRVRPLICAHRLTQRREMISACTSPCRFTTSARCRRPSRRSGNSSRSSSPGSAPWQGFPAEGRCRPGGRGCA